MRHIFFNDTATTEIYTLSLHDALPISGRDPERVRVDGPVAGRHRPDAGHLDEGHLDQGDVEDRKSTRLNSSHANISYAVFCLKKKKTFSLYSPHPNREEIYIVIAHVSP